MLIIKRKKNWAIVIDGHIRILIVDQQGQYVKLGIEAPKTIRVCREEVYQREQQQLDLNLEILNLPELES